MASKIDEAYVELTARDAKLQAALKRSSSAMDQVGKSATRMASLLKTAFAGAGAFAALNFMQRILSLTQTQIAAETKLAAVLKATRGAAGLTIKQLETYAARLQDITGIGDEVTLSAMAILASFREINGSVFKDTIRLAQDMSVVLGTDLNSAVLQLGKALNDPLVGLTMLRRSGVSFTDAQTKLIKQLIKSNDLLKAQKIIVHEVASEFGGAAKAIGETSVGAVQKLEAAFGDLGETIGKVVLPSVTAGVKELTRALQHAGEARTIRYHPGRGARFPTSQRLEGLASKSRERRAAAAGTSQIALGSAVGHAVGHATTSTLGAIAKAWNEARGSMAAARRAIDSLERKAGMAALGRALAPRPGQPAPAADGTSVIEQAEKRVDRTLDALDAMDADQHRRSTGQFYGIGGYAQSIQGGISQAEKEAARRDEERNKLLDELKAEVKELNALNNDAKFG